MRVFRIGTATLLAVLSTSSTGTATLEGQKREETLPDFNWTSIAPSRDLQYHECYDGYKCARLQVPLDWTEASGHREWVAVGIVTVPAKVPITDPSFGGTVLINPGGPGGAGTEMALLFGKSIQDLLDGKKHYEILGFDPRGIGRTTPSASCYTENLSRLEDAIQQGALPPIVSGDLGLNYHYRAAVGVGELCYQQNTRGDSSNSSSIFAYMSTASVARDMLEIVERVDATRNSSTLHGRNSTNKPLLQYYGASYGTYLGNTFASMFPDRVGRMVLDSVVDADDYTSGLWRKNLDDTETIADRFYQTCFNAGVGICPLRQPQDRSAADVRNRVDEFLRALETDPIPAVHEGRVRLLTSFLVRETIRQTLYSPVCSFEPLAAALAESIFAGNHTIILASGGALCTRIVPNYVPGDCPWCSEASFGVLCGDAAANPGHSARNISWWREQVAYIQRQSPTAAEPWARFALACVNWQFTPKYAFSGPFESSVPMLILSNRHDPATPVANAYELSRRHKRSAVVVQESYGHAAILTTTSECTTRILRKYFNSGKLPNNGTSCEADCVASIPFQPCPGIVE